MRSSPTRAGEGLWGGGGGWPGVVWWKKNVPPCVTVKENDSVNEDGNIQKLSHYTSVECFGGLPCEENGREVMHFVFTAVWRTGWKAWAVTATLTEKRSAGFYPSFSCDVFVSTTTWLRPTSRPSQPCCWCWRSSTRALVQANIPLTTALSVTSIAPRWL